MEGISSFMSVLIGGPKKTLKFKDFIQHPGRKVGNPCITTGMSLTALFLKPYFKKLAAQLDESLWNPEMAQQNALANIARIYGKHPFCQKLGFHSKITPKEMRILSPTDYFSYQEEIDEVTRSGKGSHFACSSLQCIASTTGTTSTPKKFPINKNYIKSYRRFTLALNAYCLTQMENWDFLKGGKTLALTANPAVQKTAGGLTEGYISGIMALRTPWVYRTRVLPSRKIMLMEDWEKKMDAIMDEARHQDVVSMAAMPAMAFIFSQRAVEKFGVRHLREIWPNLRGLLFGGSGLSPFMREQFDLLWGASPDRPNIYWESLAATEGQMAHTYRPNQSGMVFNTFENFYQFQDEQGSIFHLQELEEGKKYAILVTTPGGLINYRMNDWIKVISTKPLQFLFAGRDKEEISLGMERITLDQIHQTMSEVARQSQRAVPEFVFWIEESKPYRLVCGIGEDMNVDAKELESLIDETLAEVNEDYKDMRKDGMFYGPLKVQLFPNQMFKDYRARNMGRGQFKPKQVFKNEKDFRREYLGSS